MAIIDQHLKKSHCLYTSLIEKYVEDSIREIQLSCKPEEAASLGKKQGSPNQNDSTCLFSCQKKVRKAALVKVKYGRYASTLMKISRVPFYNGITSPAPPSEVSPEKPPRLHKVSGYHTKDRKGATGTPFPTSYPPASRQDWMRAADKRRSQAPTPLPLITGFLTQAISGENLRQL